jgi:hypothetical protein
MRPVYLRADGGRQRGSQKAEGRRQKGSQKAEGRRQKWSVLDLAMSFHSIASRE